MFTACPERGHREQCPPPAESQCDPEKLNYSKLGMITDKQFVWPHSSQKTHVGTLSSCW
jgi:hypothetical protein